MSTMASCTTRSAVSSPVMPNAAAVPLGLLVLHRVRRVVGGHAVDGAVGQALRAAPPTSAAVRSGGLTLKTGS